MSNTVVHGLSIFEVEKGLYRIRSTIRMGEVKSGMALSFTNSCGNKYVFTVRECKDGPSRHTTIYVDGDEESFIEFKGGYYLFGS